MEPIIESKMVFGPYPKGDCFYIEKSTTYLKVGQGVKMAEFLLLRTRDDKPPVIWVVEAKSSSPNPKNTQRFDVSIKEICEKLVNAFSLGVASCLKRHPQAEDELPEAFKTLDFSSLEFRFVLVIKGHKEEWLSPVQDALKKLLSSIVKTWALSPTSVAVINDKQARDYGLISSDNDETA